jgi:hypothetical protein
MISLLVFSLTEMHLLIYPSADSLFLIYLLHSLNTRSSFFHPAHALHYPATFSPLKKMSTITTTRQLVKEISTLSNSLLDSVPKGTKDNKIWSVMNSAESEIPHETFNRRFDALFGEDCRDSDGRLQYVRQGKLGLGLVVSYLSKINWTSFPLDLIELKLHRLIKELKNLQCIPNFIVFHSFD